MKVKVILIFIITTSLAFAGSLDDVVREALLKSPEIKIAKEQFKITDYQYREAIGKFLPSISFDYSKIHLSDVPSFTLSVPSLPPSSFNMVERDYYSLRLSLRQPLFTGGYLTFNLLKSRSEKSAAYYRFLEAVNQVVNRVKNDYYTLSEAKTSIEIAKSFLKSAREHYNDVRAFFDEGIVARRDLLEAEVKVKEAEEKLEKAKNFYKVALEKLRKDVGDPNLKVVVESLKFRKFEMSEEKALKIAFSRRPLLRSAEEEKKGSKYGIKLAYSQFMPKVSLAFSYDRTDQYPMNGNFKSKSAGIFLSFPIFEGTQRFWRVKQARGMLNVANFTIENVRRLIRLQVISAYSNLKTSQARLETAKSMVKKAKELLRDSKERYREHVGTSTEVTDAIAYLVEAKGMLNSALADYNRALSDLEFAIGGSLK